jgi:D-alanyl-D-alanine carboxypeptidase
MPEKASTMKLKLDAAGAAVLLDGKPVYTHDDGKDLPFDAVATVATISRLNGEARTHREAKEAAETKLKAFEGITDPEAAKKAMETIGNIDAKKLIDAGEVEKVKTEAIKAIEEKYAPVVAERDKLQGELYGEKIGGAFARSKFIADKLAIPSDFAQARFGQNFKIEDGKMVAYDSTGNKLFSRSKPGELADFEEAFEMLVDQYPQKEHILKGSGSQGTGATGSDARGQGQKTMPRSEFDKMDPAQQRQTVSGGVTVTD